MELHQGIATSCSNRRPKILHESATPTEAADLTRESVRRCEMPGLLLSNGGFMAMGVPQKLDGLCHGTSH